MSIALEVCRITEERLGGEHLDRVRAVALEVGDDAGVERDNLAFCLEALLAEPPFGGAKPLIVRGAGDALRLSYIEVDDDG